MSDEIKSKIIEQANMYLDGKSLREIAATASESHVTVRRNLTVKLRDIDKDLYNKVAAKLEENMPDSIDKKEVIDRVLAAYQKLVLENKTVIQIASELNSTEFTIYRDLTKRLPLIKEAHPELVNDEMVASVSLIFTRHSSEALLSSIRVSEKELDVLEQISEEIISIMDTIKKMYPIKKNRLAFISLATLTFGISLDTLAELLQVDRNLLYQDLMSQDEYKKDLENLFSHGYHNQKLAKERFLDFISRLEVAYETNDNKKINDILFEIYDIDATILKNSNKSSEDITEDDIRTLLIFQIKYLYRNEDIQEIFGIDSSFYEKQVEKYLSDHPEDVLIAKQYNSLKLFHEKMQTGIEKYEVDAATFMGGSKTMQDICQMFPNLNKRISFITNCAISFGINIDTLSKILGIDSEALYSVLMDSPANWPIYYLFHFRNPNQGKAMFKFSAFFRQLKKANAERDLDKIKEILSTYIGDVKAKEFIAKRQKGDLLSNSDLETIIRYQVKYGLNSLEIGKLFNINSKNYANRANSYLNDMNNNVDKDLRVEYQILQGVSRSAHFREKL